MNAYTLLTDVRSNLDESSAKHWTDATILNKLNQAYLGVYMMMVKSRGAFFQKSSDLTPVASVITLPSDFRKLIHLEDKTTKSPISIIPVRTKNLTKQISTATFINELTGYFLGNTLVVNCDSYTSQVTMYYEKTLQRMHAGTGDSGSTTNSLIFDSDGVELLDDYYNDLYVQITGGTGVGTRAQITDYVGSTRAATVSGSFSTTSTYGTELEVPDEAEAFLILKATVSCLAKPSSALDPKYFEFFMADYMDARRDLKTFIGDRYAGGNVVRTSFNG